MDKDVARNFIEGGKSMNQIFVYNEIPNYHLFGINKISTNENT